MGYSFGVLKPDCLERGLRQRAFSRIEGVGLTVVFEKKLRFSRADAEFLYDRCRSSSFFENLVRFMTSNDVVVYVVKGDGCAIETLNEVVGHTNPSLAKSGTLRSLGESVCRNISHSTASPETLKREASYFLSTQERMDIGLAF